MNPRRPGREVLEIALNSVSYSSEYGRENILAAEVHALRADLVALTDQVSVLVNKFVSTYRGHPFVILPPDLARLKLLAETARKELGL